MKMKKFGLSETKLFNFHGIFKNGGHGWGLERTPSGSATANMSHPGHHAWAIIHQSVTFTIILLSCVKGRTP